MESHLRVVSHGVGASHSGRQKEHERRNRGHSSKSLHAQSLRASSLRRLVNPRHPAELRFFSGLTLGVNRQVFIAKAASEGVRAATEQRDRPFGDYSVADEANRPDRAHIVGER
jgi:hypothetical protein